VQNASGLQVGISGNIQPLLVGGTVGVPTAINYGADTDAWTVPYLAGKTMTAWNGTTSHSLTLPLSVNGFNLFLSDGTAGKWFDLIDADFDGDKWGVTGDCWRDGTKLMHGPLGPLSGEIRCTNVSGALQVEILGSVENLLVGSPVSDAQSIVYGSNVDGWTVPYSVGKSFVSWNGSAYHRLLLPPTMTQFNLFLSDGSGGKWFDLVDADYDGDKWTVTGSCSLSGTYIVH
jgi:hypothetical protein